MVLCAAAALGTHSRGALLAISAMALVLWWRGKSLYIGGVFMLMVGISLVTFMPDAWTERMSTIASYEEDRSAVGRISAWWNAWGIAKDYVFGIGFDAARPELFARYSPFPDAVHAAHSIYFQILGNHGFVGLALFLAVFVTTYWWAAQLRREASAHPEAAWCEVLAAMAQVSLIGYAVGGAFLSLSYFDLPYNILVMVVLARLWVRCRAWEVERLPKARWYGVPGLIPPVKAN
jgi:probable O-glycosylation ligase (exosortase A-associated)